MFVVLDPGHGGRGARNRGPTRYVEPEGTLDIARRTREWLLKRVGGTDLEVMLTREADVDLGGTPYNSSRDLASRAGLANHLKADAFVSIHTNAGDGKARGTETYASVRGGLYRQLAEAVHRPVVQALGTLDRGVRVRRGKNGQDYYGILRYALVPACLIEVMFHDNPEEERRLLDPGERDKAARAIADGLAAFLGLPAAIAPRAPKTAAAPAPAEGVAPPASPAKAAGSGSPSAGAAGSRPRPKPRTAARRSRRR